MIPEPGDVFELPARLVLSLVDPTVGSGLLSYANAAQNAPVSQGSATSSPLYTQGLSTVTGAAQTAPTATNGATVQNVNSPNSFGSATTTSG